jgi:hypothetical protein
VVEAIVSARTPIILLVVAAVLLGYVLVFERDRPGPAEIESRSGLLLATLVRERITRVRISSGPDSIVLRRHGEGFDETWTIEKPNEAPVDPEAIEDYLRGWEYSVPIRTLESPSAQDLQSFGIEEPKAEVSFEMGRAKIQVSLGSGAPVDGGGYVRIDDGPAVIVVGPEVVELFNRHASAFELKGDAGAPDLSDLLDGGAEAADSAR